MGEELENSIKDNAAGPKRVTGDAGTVEQHSLKDQIDADRYLNSKKVTKKKGLGIKISKIIPPGSV